MVKLPDRLALKLKKSVNIQSIKRGRSAYATPWSMFPGPEGHMYISGNAPISDSSGGTFELKVTRDSSGGINVDASLVSSCWHYSVVWTMRQQLEEDSIRVQSIV